MGGGKKSLESIYKDQVVHFPLKSFKFSNLVKSRKINPLSAAGQRVRGRDQCITRE